MVTAKGDQPADIQGRLFPLVASHGTISLFDPPTNRSFIGVISPIQNRLPILGFPGAIKGQAGPEVPTIQEQVAHPIGSTGHLSFLGRSGPGITVIQSEKFMLFMGLARMDQFPQTMQICQGLSGSTCTSARESSRCVSSAWVSERINSSVLRTTWLLHTC